MFRRIRKSRSGLRQLANPYREKTAWQRRTSSPLLRSSSLCDEPTTERKRSHGQGNPVRVGRVSSRVSLGPFGPFRTMAVALLPEVQAPGRMFECLLCLRAVSSHRNWFGHVHAVDAWVLLPPMLAGLFTERHDVQLSVA